MARGVCCRSSSYDRNLLPYVVFSNFISLIVFIDRDVYDGDNVGLFFLFFLPSELDWQPSTFVCMR